MKKVSLIITILMLASPVLAGYYADVELIINEQGTASITGLTNHPLLAGETSNLTSKQGIYWTFNLTINELFDYYVIKVTLPAGAVINYLKTPDSVRISEELGSIRILASGNNETVRIITQYNIEPFKINLDWLWLLVLMTIPAVITLLIKLKKPKKKVNHSLLTERESLIIKQLEKKKMISQRELEKILKIPKASVSRNINSLIRKGLVKKEKKGITNVIVLKKD